MENPTYTLVSGEERAEQHPATFQIPPKVLRDALLPGANVKLMFKSPEGQIERMWVEITHGLNEGTYEGFLNNDPVIVAAKWKDIVRFGPEHIIAILTSNDFQHLSATLH